MFHALVHSRLFKIPNDNLIFIPESTLFSNLMVLSLSTKDKPMAGSEPTTFRLQGECSSQAELHWHEVQ